ncbi:MAG: ASKHA domain-containing protein [Armatimonadota bacterium]
MDGRETSAGVELAKIRFEPDGIEIQVPVGTIVAKAALMAGCAVEMNCGGTGTCGKCRVKVAGKVDQPDSSEKRFLTTEELARGMRLACRARVTGDAVVAVPIASRSLVQKVLSHGIIHDVHVAPAVMKAYLDLPKPSLTDERGDFERLAASLTVYDIETGINVQIARELPSILREAGYKVTAVVDGSELIAVEPGDTVRQNYGIAFDLGSTTIAGYLMDLNTGYEIAVASVINPQVSYGDDLVSRINFAGTEPGGLNTLREAAIDALNEIADRLAKTQKIDPKNIYEVTLVGNTCMTHLFMGLNVSTLGLSPYVPTLCRKMTLRGDEAGLHINPGALVHVMPNVAGFVGSDLIGVVLATLREDEYRTRLAVDVGTNGEMALLHNGQIYACSAAAGPAFEGARISRGMRGAPGAIDSVRIGRQVEITTIEDCPAVGICGSGLVDAVSEMLSAGIIDDSGRMLTPDEAGHLPPDIRARLIESDTGPEFILATEQESVDGKPLTLKQKDVRQLQLAKGSIRAAVETLMKIAGATIEDLDDILLAGSFGNYIRIESALRIGLLPPVEIDRIIPVGNAAGAGAKLALISTKERERASRLAAAIKHIELASHPDYRNEFVENMLFTSPSTKATAN